MWSAVLASHARSLPRLQRSGRRDVDRVRVRSEGKREKERLSIENNGFLPFPQVLFSRKAEEFCQHKTEIVVEETISRCFQIWNHWDNLVDFLDLIGELAKDPENPKVATFFCYYRYGYNPVMQVMFRLHKTEVEDDAFILFESNYGMPLKGIVEFEEIEDHKTKVCFRCEHPLPLKLLELNIGILGVEIHMQRILDENMATFKELAEGRIQFSKDKYDAQRAYKEILEQRDAMYQSKWISNNKDYYPAELDTFSEEFTEYQLFSDEPDL